MVIFQRNPKPSKRQLIQELRTAPFGSNYRRQCQFLGLCGYTCKTRPSKPLVSLLVLQRITRNLQSILVGCQILGVRDNPVSPHFLLCPGALARHCDDKRCGGQKHPRPLWGLAREAHRGLPSMGKLNPETQKNRSLAYRRSPYKCRLMNLAFRHSLRCVHRPSGLLELTFNGSGAVELDPINGACSAHAPSSQENRAMSRTLR